jgi:hypothetical protein
MEINALLAFAVLHVVRKAIDIGASEFLAGH